MSKFKVGMRVKRVCDPFPCRANETPLWIGDTGVVDEVDEAYVYVVPDVDRGSVFSRIPWGCYPNTLEPEMPDKSKEEEFLAKLKDLGNQPKIPDSPVAPDIDVIVIDEPAFIEIGLPAWPER